MLSISIAPFGWSFSGADYKAILTLDTGVISSSADGDIGKSLGIYSSDMTLRPISSVRIGGGGEVDSLWANSETTLTSNFHNVALNL